MDEPVFARDFVLSNIEAGIGYLASVLRPGMTDDQIRTNVNIFQTRNGTEYLNKTELEFLIANYNIEASASQNIHAKASDSIIILSEKSRNRILVINGGVDGPVSTIGAGLLGAPTAVTNADQLVGIVRKIADAAYAGTSNGVLFSPIFGGGPLREVDITISLFNSVISRFPTAIIDFRAHSLGKLVSDFTYAHLVQNGYGDRVGTVTGFSGLGFDRDVLGLERLARTGALPRSDDLIRIAEYAKILDNVNFSRKIVNIGADGDFITGDRQSLITTTHDNVKFFGRNVTLIDDTLAITDSLNARVELHNLLKTRRLLANPNQNISSLFQGTPIFFSTNKL